MRHVAICIQLWPHQVCIDSINHAAAFLPRISPVFMFQPAAVGLHSFVAMMMALAYMLNSCLSAIAIRLVVARAKKCWDFGATIYLFHFGFTWLVDGFPQRATWWILMAGCGTVTVLLGEFLCVQFEMADIPITGLGAHSLLSGHLKHIMSLTRALSVQVTD